MLAHFLEKKINTKTIIQVAVPRWINMWHLVKSSRIVLVLFTKDFPAQLRFCSFYPSGLAAKFLRTNADFFMRNNKTSLQVPGGKIEFFRCPPVGSLSLLINNFICNKMFRAGSKMLIQGSEWKEKRKKYCCMREQIYQGPSKQALNSPQSLSWTNQLFWKKRHGVAPSNCGKNDVIRLSANDSL